MVRTVLLFASFLLLMALTGCGGGEQEETSKPLEISPKAFVLLPCGDAHVPCALAVAGGKRVLFGAPAGISNAIQTEDLRQLDAVVVFSLRAQDIEGLDEVRNASWHAGRSEPLLVIGPTGIEDVIAALNSAFEQADALYVVEEGSPPGGYDAAILVALEARANSIVFDTGDLVITKQRGAYRVDYNRQGRAILNLCAPGLSAQQQNTPDTDTVTIACTGGAEAHTWPLTNPIFVTKTND